jgi:hypothetical protein
MTLRQLLSPQARAALFDPPTEVRAIVRHYTFSIEDVALIRQRRRNANRLGFAVHLAYLRFPGRVLGPNETPPAHLLAFIADQLRINPKSFENYAQRDETRREHLAELQAYLGMRSFGREDYRIMARIAFNESIGTDRGDAIVGAMVVHLRHQSILLPSPAVLEKVALAARARARKQAYKALTAGVDQAVREKLDALIKVADSETRTALAWLREWPEAPLQKNLAGIVERLQLLRALGIGPDRERRIHRARYAAIARETAILSAQHLYRFDEQRRLATLVVFAREMEVELTDAALTMFDKMMGGVFRKADRRHKDQLVNRAKMLHSSTRALVSMAKAMLSARANGTDPLAAIEQTIGWQRLEALVEAMDQSLEAARADNLAEVIDSYPRVHRTATIILGAFTFRSWKSTDPVLTALDVLHQLYASEQRKLPAGVPTSFLTRRGAS